MAPPAPILRPMIRTVRLAAALAVALATTLAAPAADAQRARAPIELSARDRADVTRVERYLAGLTTLRAAFRQVAQDGGEASGTFHLSRPGRMRIDYDGRRNNFIVADGTFIYQWDDSLKSFSSTFIGQTMADLILRADVRLSGDVAVTGLDRQPGRLEIAMVQASEPLQGELTLVFEDGSRNDGPLALRQWRVIDAQGLATVVTLFGVETGMTLDRRLFQFNDPRGREQGGGDR
ncbi:MAG: LolA family protein [Rhodospirillales bacterium]|jgi:outer membrane lipoprotein-sorting protein